MPAPNDETVLNFETNFETALKIFLATDTGLGATSLFATLDQDSFVVPRVEVMMEIGEALDPAIPKFSTSTDLEYMQYKASLSVRAVSDASTDGSQTNHRTIRSKIRKSLQRNSLNFTTPDGSTTILPYYSVVYIRPTGTVYEVDGDLAVSTMTYDITFSIKDDAFPTS